MSASIVLSTSLRLKEKFNLEYIRVVDTFSTGEILMEKLGRAGADILERLIKKVHSKKIFLGRRITRLNWELVTALNYGML